MLLTHARRAARIDGNGVTIPLARQDRRKWDAAAIAEGAALVERALMRRRPGPYQIKAAIAACHCEGSQSDWPQIAALYDVLLALEPTDIVRLNRAVARAEAGQPRTGLRKSKGWQRPSLAISRFTRLAPNFWRGSAARRKRGPPMARRSASRIRR